MSAHARRGIALLTTLLGVLVLEVVIAGAFHVAMQQRRIATSYTRGVQLQLAARSTAAAGLANWATLATDSVAVGATIPVMDGETAGLRTGATLRRVATYLFLLRAEARFTATGETHAVAAILREHTLAEFLEGIRAVVVARAATGDVTLEGSPPAECDVPDGAPAAIPTILLEDSTGATGVVHSGAQRPYTEVAGLDVSGVPESLPAVRVVSGDFSLEVDLDEAVLVVHGDLVVQPGVRFRGVLLVGGSLHLLPGAAVHGAAQVEGWLVGEDAAVRYDPCVLAALFRAHSFLRGPLRAASHWWIPAA